MKFDDLETTWKRQPAAAPDAAAATAAAYVLNREVARGSFYLKVLICCFSLGLVLELEPLFRVLAGKPGAGITLLKMIAHEALYVPALIFLIRRLREHRVRVRACGESLRTAMGQLLASVEARMWDYRWMGWFAVPATALALWSAYANQAVAREGIVAFWPRAAFVLIFVAVGGAIGAWEYHQRLVPERNRLRELADGWNAQ
jgi:hypothetical protein